MHEWIFAGSDPVMKTVVVGVGTYIALIVTLRVSGKRTLSKMNAFDLVVTVALGSTVATILLSKDVALVQGLVALALLVALQYVVAWLSVKSPWFSELVKSEPTLLVLHGRVIDAAMRRERVAAVEIEQAARMNGASRVEDIGALVLETDGSFSVLHDPPHGHRHLDVSSN